MRAFGPRLKATEAVAHAWARSRALSSTASIPSKPTLPAINICSKPTHSLRILRPCQFNHRVSRSFTSTSVMASTRAETDAFGEIQVQSDKYWGAQTERSLENFKINQPQDRMAPPIVRAFGILKGAAATVNMKYGLGMCGPL